VLQRYLKTYQLNLFKISKNYEGSPYYYVTVGSISVNMERNYAGIKIIYIKASRNYVVFNNIVAN
jgi:hypothetical protein